MYLQKIPNWWTADRQWGRICFMSPTRHPASFVFSFLSFMFGFLTLLLPRAPPPPPPHSFPHVFYLSSLCSFSPPPFPSQSVLSAGYQVKVKCMPLSVLAFPWETGQTVPPEEKKGKERGLSALAPSLCNSFTLTHVSVILNTCNKPMILWFCSHAHNRSLSSQS